MENANNECISSRIARHPITSREKSKSLQSPRQNSASFAHGACHRQCQQHRSQSDHRGPIHRVSIDGPNEIGFIGVDSIAGMPIAGSYEYNPQGVVTGYGFKAFADEIDLPDLFVWADLGGSAGDFYLRTMLFVASGNSLYLAN
jgi:hypothetical protein